MTGHHVAEPFLSTWRANGGLPIFGYPLSELLEVHGMQVQYVERARFELHPENTGTEYEVLLTLLGSWLAGERAHPAYTPFPADAGHEIGAHTFSHPDLTKLSDSQLAWELTSVRAELRAASGQSVDFFAYPYGAYDARVIAATRAASYRGALAAWGGSWWSPDTPWTEPRIEVSGFLSLNGFVALVR